MALSASAIAQALKQRANNLGDELSAPIRQAVKDPLSLLASSGDKIPKTATKNTYGMSLMVRTPRQETASSQIMTKVGGVYSISPSQSLEVDEEYEVNKHAIGLPSQIVKQALRGRTLTLSRYELNRATLTNLFRFQNPAPNLIYQIPFYLRIVWKTSTASGIESLFSSDVTQIEEYGPCTFTSLGQTYSVDDRVVGIQATMTWVNYTVINL